MIDLVKLLQDSLIEKQTAKRIAEQQLKYREDLSKQKNNELYEIAKQLENCIIKGKRLVVDKVKDIVDKEYVRFRLDDGTFLMAANNENNINYAYFLYDKKLNCCFTNGDVEGFMVSLTKFLAHL